MLFFRSGVDVTPEAREILGNLERVAKERQDRDTDPGLLASTLAVKRYQHARFEKTYGDLLAEPRYRAAARFFLEELYGPQDFSERDSQFARIVSPLAGMFPQEVVMTVLALSELHALSEDLDTRMGRALSGTALSGAAYALGWQSVGRAPERRRQIELLGAVGRALDGYTRNPLLRQALRLMRGPARAAGLGALQRFLENGFESFRSMGGASRFLALINERESRLGASLFEADPAALAEGTASVLAELPGE